MLKVILCLLCLALASGCTSPNLQQPHVTRQDETPREERQSVPIQKEETPTPYVSGVEGAPHLPLIEEPEEESILIIFETPILDYTKNRINNIRLACKAVSGTILTPGEEFSFNTVVGPRTVEKGYKEAIIFRKNEKVKEVGGGICQLTSTLYGAAKAAGFIITERTTHQLLVDYVEEGEDATVYFGKIDFKFINNLDRQVRIDASCGDGKVAVTITSII